MSDQFPVTLTCHTVIHYCVCAMKLSVTGYYTENIFLFQCFSPKDCRVAPPYIFNILSQIYPYSLFLKMLRRNCFGFAYLAMVLVSPVILFQPCDSIVLCTGDFSGAAYHCVSLSLFSSTVLVTLALVLSWFFISMSILQWIYFKRVLLLFINKMFSLKIRLILFLEFSGFGMLFRKSCLWVVSQPEPFG